MNTKNLGLVKAIFNQSTTPTRTDVLWYDSINGILKGYNNGTRAWLPIMNFQLTGALTDGFPTSAEITAIVGMTAVAATAGWKCTIKDNTGTGLLYLVESDGTDWEFLRYVKAV